MAPSWARATVIRCSRSVFGPDVNDSDVRWRSVLARASAAHGEPPRRAPESPRVEDPGERGYRASLSVSEKRVRRARPGRRRSPPAGRSQFHQLLCLQAVDDNGVLHQRRGACWAGAGEQPVAGRATSVQSHVDRGTAGPGRTVLVMSIKRQPDIRVGDRCIRCGERVRPLLDDGAPAERVQGGATSVGWTCACATIEGPQVPARDQFFVVATEPLINDDDKQASSGRCTGSWRRWERLPPATCRFIAGRFSGSPMRRLRMARWNVCERRWLRVA